jgi:LemA protein
MASQAFVQLQGELANTEDRIAAGRRFYNANVRSLNTKVETFPASLAAGMFHITRAEYFEPTAPDYRAVPQVSFGAAPTPPMPPAAPGSVPGPPPVSPAGADGMPPVSPAIPSAGVPGPPPVPPAMPGMPPVAPPGPQV